MDKNALYGIVSKFLTDAKMITDPKQLRDRVNDFEKEFNSLSDRKAVTGDAQNRTTVAARYMEKLNRDRAQGKVVKVNTLVNSLKKK